MYEIIHIVQYTIKSRAEMEPYFGSYIGQCASYILNVINSMKNYPEYPIIYDSRYIADRHRERFTEWARMAFPNGLPLDPNVLTSEQNSELVWNGIETGLILRELRNFYEFYISNKSQTEEVEILLGFTNAVAAFHFHDITLDRVGAIIFYKDCEAIREVCERQKIGYKKIIIGLPPDHILSICRNATTSQT